MKKCIMIMLCAALGMGSATVSRKLAMFTEYSMANPREMAEFFGFTEAEVTELCRQYG